MSLECLEKIIDVLRQALPEPDAAEALKGIEDLEEIDSSEQLRLYRQIIALYRKKAVEKITDPKIKRIFEPI